MGEEQGQAQGEGPRCLRVVCLHGAAGGRRIFEWQIGKLLGHAKGRIEFIILEGPRECADEEAIKTMSMFQGIPMMEYDAVRFDDRNWPAYDAPRETLGWLQARLAELAPVDGLVGFSQGAAFAAMLAAQASRGAGRPLSFVCLLCPHAPGYVRQLPELFPEDAPVRVPLLLVRGEREDYDEGFKETLRGRRIQRHGCRMPSEHVLRLFEDVEVLTHREGHRPIPADRTACQEVLERVSGFALRWGHWALAGAPPAEVAPGLLVRLGESGPGAPLDGPLAVVQHWRAESGHWAVRSEESGEEALVKRNHLALQERGPCIACGEQTHHCHAEGVGWCCAPCWEASWGERQGAARAWQAGYLRALTLACEGGTAQALRRGAATPVPGGAEEAEEVEEVEGAEEAGEAREAAGAGGTAGSLSADEAESEGEDPVEAFNFLARTGLLPRRLLAEEGGPAGAGGQGDAPLDEGLLSMLRPKQSRAQGTVQLKGFEFTSAFDGGNALHTAWRFEGESGGVRTFATRIARDCHGSDSARTKNFWFNFGVTPLDPAGAAGASVRLVVRGMSQQADLFDNGYAPWCCAPSSGDLWRRVPGEVSYGPEESGGSGSERSLFQLSWLHSFEPEDAAGATFFAFCQPFSYADLLRSLARIEEALAAPRPRALGFPCFRPLSVRPGRGVYFHRQVVARTPQGRVVELLTVTADGEPEGHPAEPAPFGRYDELPGSVRQALGGLPSAPPLRFPGRPVCFVSGRVHPGETPGQFATLGFLQFLLSDDPRAGLLRERFVFKIAPMLNPDGVAWGHSRTNSLGHDLNRCYQQPTFEQHEGVAAVKALLLSWAERGELLFYLDCHGHAGVRGCFVFGNELPDEWDFMWSVAYAHAAQLNCPHIDIENCMWSTAPRPGVNSPDHDSGRNQVGWQCGLYHAYTLECNYNCGRLVRPVPEAPGLPASSALLQAVRGMPMSRSRGRLAPVAYDALSWAAVGEGLAVALLDLHAEHRHSRLLGQLPPKYIHSDKGERAHHPNLLKGLAELWPALAARHAQAAERAERAEGGAARPRPPRRPAPEPGEQAPPWPRRGAVCLVALDNVCLRERASAASRAVGVRCRGDRVVVEEECGEGWVRVRMSAFRKQDATCPAGAVVLGSEVGHLQVYDKLLGLPVLVTLDHADAVYQQRIRRCHAPPLEDLQRGTYPPPLLCST